MQRQNISSGSPWEDVIGYSRAVRINNVIEVSGTTAMDGDKLVGKDDVYAQTIFILKKIEQVLLQAGAHLHDVIRTRIYVTNIANWEAVGKAHGEIFSHIKPATSMVEVSRLIGDELLIEIEATAIISQNS